MFFAILFVSIETGVLGSRSERFGSAWPQDIRPVRDSPIVPDAVGRRSFFPVLIRVCYCSVPARDANLALLLRQVPVPGVAGASAPDAGTTVGACVR